MPEAILDCSSLEGAIDSLDRLLRLPHGQLRSELASIDLAWMGAPVAPEEQLVQALGFRSERELPVPDGIRWFHVTRAPKDTTFEEGLLPTDKMLSRLWAFLGSLAAQWSSPAEWAEFQITFTHGGDHKDFTRIPEVLEDICGDYADLTGHPLHQAYEQATHPCVVEFTTRGGRYGAVRAALNYAHRTLRGFEHGVECNTCFTGKGHAVPRACIDRIDWL